jgi:hypothetical protein
MSQPQPFQRSYSYTNSFAANPTQVFPGNALDTELNNIKATTDQVLQNLTLLQNNDGAVRNDHTIGSALSGATYANADAQCLYTLLWNNVTNTYAPVTGGRGGSAAADWPASGRPGPRHMPVGKI